MGFVVLRAAIRLFRMRALLWDVQKKIVLLTVGYICAIATDRAIARLISPRKVVVLVLGSRRADFYLAGWNNALLSISDRHTIRWLTSSFSYAGVEADLVVFGLRPRHFLSHAFAFSLLYFASFLRSLGQLDEAAQLYGSLKRHKGLLGTYGCLGLADLKNLVLLWERYDNERDTRLANFELHDGLRNFLVRRQNWRFAADADKRDVRRLCIKAILNDRSIPFAYYELARYHDQWGNIKAAARFARIAVNRARKRVKTQPFLEREACRLEVLAAESVTFEPLTMLSRFESLTKGDAKLVKVVSDISQLKLMADSSEYRTATETCKFSYMLYSDGSRRQIEKSLQFARLQSFKVRSGFIPGFSGAPFVSDEGYTVSATTAYPTYPGREIFVPALWGGYRDRELFVERNGRFVRDIVCLPGVSTNFYHFVFDALGSLSFVDPAELEERQLLAFGGPLQRFQMELLAELRIPEERLTLLPQSTQTIRFENGIFPCYSSANNVSSPHVARWLRSRLYRPRAITLGKRVYLARRTVRDFSTDDRQSILALMTRFGFRVVHPETMSIAEVRHLLADAEAVAIDAGAAAVNLLFVPPGAKAILIGTLLGYTECFTPLTSVCELDLHVVLGDTGVHPKYLFAWSQFEPVADIHSLRACLDNIF
jgi:hypothetical protein